MTLATRCISCGTIFRVVQDQLRVSEGWVRCGRCDEVFDASQNLFDMDRDAPPAWPPAPPDPDTQRETVGVRFRAPSYDEQAVAELDEDDRIASRFFQEEQDDVARTPAQKMAERDREEFEDAKFNFDLLPSELNPNEPPPPPPEPKPTFVQKAESKERWSHPLARSGLTIAASFLSLLLVIQVLVQFRDTTAARFAFLRPVVAGLCAIGGCSLGAPRRIDDVVVESSALARAPGGEDRFRLSVTLRNRGTLPVATPDLDLTLTDVNGALVARRALTPAEFAREAVIPPNGDVAAQVILVTGNPAVSGYTVEVFYP